MTDTTAFTGGPAPSDLKTIRDYFGFREGTKLADFALEVKALTDEDKRQLADGIRNGSLTY